MKIFFDNPVFKGKVAYTDTELSIEELKKMQVLADDTKFLINPEHDILMITEISCVKFDNLDNPTKLVVDLDTLHATFLEKIRLKRDPVLSALDKLQTTALSKSNLTVAAQIEEDKNVLRNLTDTIDLTTITEIKHLYTRVPAELLVDYSDKYANI